MKSCILLLSLFFLVTLVAFSQSESNREPPPDKPRMEQKEAPDSVRIYTSSTWHQSRKFARKKALLRKMNNTNNSSTFQTASKRHTWIGPVAKNRHAWKSKRNRKAYLNTVPKTTVTPSELYRTQKE
ncbi:MAG: hypothetical protein AAF587_40695 [Bacteroidota bacterium]